MTNKIIKILHVEDDDGDAMEVKRACDKTFGRGNYELVRVDSLGLAKGKLEEDPFDAVLLDLNLGDDQGLGNVFKIKETNQDVPIVVLSGHDDTETALKCVRSGAQEYLIKGHGDDRTFELSVLTSIERKIYERHLFTLANKDELTGLPNRRAFLEHMKQQCMLAARWQRKEYVLFMDVNGFKQVNDTFGHEVGDKLLQEIAKKIKSVLRASDMLARFAGDEFIVHLDLNANERLETVTQVAEKISVVFDLPLLIDGQEIKTGISIGISGSPEGGRDTELLIKAADQAMYEAKETGKRFVFTEVE